MGSSDTYILFVTSLKLAEISYHLHTVFPKSYKVSMQIIVFSKCPQRHFAIESTGSNVL